MKRKSVREVVENPRNDECYILVTRYYPRELRKKGISFEESPFENPFAGREKLVTELAPSVELLTDWKGGKISWEEYEERFREELPEAELESLLELSQSESREIVLCCIEEEDEYPHCHAWILLDLIEKLEGEEKRS